MMYNARFSSDVIIRNLIQQTHFGVNEQEFNPGKQIHIFGAKYTPETDMITISYKFLQKEDKDE